MRNRIATAMLAVFLLVGMLSTSAQAITVSPELWAEIQAQLAEQNERMEQWHAEHPVETATPVATDTAENNQNSDGAPIASPNPTLSKTYYPDVPSNAWYAQAVNTMTKGGLLKGYDDGLFHPDDLVDQGTFAAILCRLIGKSEVYEPMNEPGWWGHVCDKYFGTHTFGKPSHWAAGAIWRISETGMYLLPLGGETAYDPVWRVDAIYVMNELALWSNYQNGGPWFDKDGNILHPTQKVWTKADIPDWDVIAYDSAAQSRDANDLTKHPDGATYDIQYAGHFWLAGGIIEAYNLGFTKGIDEAGTCDPKGTLTRAELCQMLYNAGWTTYDSAHKH